MDYVFTSACITGQLFRATGCGDGVMVKIVVNWALNNSVAMVSIDCPETTFIGLPRKPIGKKQYLKTKIHLTCDEIVDKMVQQSLNFNNAGHNLIGIIGIKFSPLCCTIKNSKSVYLQTGILMEKLQVFYPDIPFISATDKHKVKTLSELLTIKNVRR